MGFRRSCTPGLCCMDRAFALLAESEMVVAEVAAELGYYDQPHMCSEFADLVGVPPAAIRCRAIGE